MSKKQSTLHSKKDEDVMDAQEELKDLLTEGLLKPRMYTFSEVKEILEEYKRDIIRSYN